MTSQDLRQTEEKGFSPGPVSPTVDPTSPHLDAAECEGCLGPITEAEIEAERATGFLICTHCIEALLGDQTQENHYERRR
jgi:hypothetical protein